MDSSDKATLYACQFSRPPMAMTPVRDAAHVAYQAGYEEGRKALHDETINLLAVHLYGIASDLGMVGHQPAKWDDVGMFWRTNFIAMAKEAMAFLFIQKLENRT